MTLYVLKHALSIDIYELKGPLLFSLPRAPTPLHPVLDLVNLVVPMLFVVWDFHNKPVFHR